MATSRALRFDRSFSTKVKAHEFRTLVYVISFGLAYL